MSNLIRKDSIDELCAHRDRALQLYAQAFEALRGAQAAHRRACTGLAYISGLPDRAFSFIRPHDTGTGWADQEMRPRLDADMWRALLVNTQLGSLMDAQERKAFDEGLQNPAPIDPDTVYATLRRLYDEGATIFRRGLVDAFRNLSREHRSNDGFSLGPRCIVRQLVQVTTFRNGARTDLWVRLSNHGEQALRDVDRVLHILAGRPAPGHLQGICQALRDAVAKANKLAPDESWQASTDLLRVRFHRNGTGHLFILDDELRAKANRVIAEHFGAALGAGADVASHRRNAA